MRHDSQIASGISGGHSSPDEPGRAALWGAIAGECAQERAEGLIRAGLKRKGWTEKDLQERRKGEQFKVRLADQLRAETTVTLRWMAARLCIGTRGHLPHLLYWQNREKSPKQQSRRLKI